MVKQLIIELKHPPVDNEDPERNITCSSCGGTGNIVQESETHHYDECIIKRKNHSNFDLSFEFIFICPKCRGRGKVDWISNIIGSKEGYFVITGIQNHRKEGST